MTRATLRLKKPTSRQLCQSVACSNLTDSRGEFCAACKPKLIKYEPVALSFEKGSLDKRKTVIYFIQEQSDRKYIKIGHANDINNRLAALQTSNPYELVILHTIETSHRFETNMHEYFSEYRARGEWFTPADGILDFITNSKKGIYPFSIGTLLKLYAANGVA